MNNDFIKVKKLEIELLDPYTRKNRKRLNELISEDFLEFTSVGFITNKKDVLKRLPKQSLVNWKVSNLKIRQLSKDILIVTYKVKKKNLKDNNITLSLRSSIWKNTNNNWKMVFHQGTLIG
jgi:hypothetical protein